ncbi:MAG: DUF2188 domain-containing protein [Actinomycetota bacterium]
MPRRTRYTVDQDTNGRWQGKRGSDVVVSGATKADVVKKTIATAKKDDASQVVIKGRDGRIQEERTYPR